jgi:hypothetical protein
MVYREYDWKFKIQVLEERISELEQENLMLKIASKPHPKYPMPHLSEIQRSLEQLDPNVFLTGEERKALRLYAKKLRESEME